MSETIIYRGDTAEIRFTILAADGSNQDLTGATSEWKLGPMGSNVSPLVTKESGSGIAPGSESNILVVSLSSADTQDLPAKNYVHQLRINFANGSKKTVYRGPISLKNLL